MMAAVKTQNQALFRDRTSSGWNRRMAKNRAVAGFLRLVQLVSRITRKWSKLKSEYVG